MTEQHIVIVGGGIAGMVAALLIANRDPAKQITLVERSEALGGLLKSFDYGENGCFDHGVHMVQESLIPELDKILVNALPMEDWDVLAGSRRDIGGNYLNGRLHTQTPYLDLRQWDEATFRACLVDFWVNLSHPVQPEPENAYAYSVARLGKVVTETVIEPALQKLFKRPLKELHRLPLRFFPFERIGLFNDAVVEDLTQSELLRSRVCYNDQRKLPLERSSGKRSFYPKAFGMQRWVEKLQEQLSACNVSVLLQSQITRVCVTQGKVQSLCVQENSGQETVLAVEELFWSAGVHSLAAHLGLTHAEEQMDKPLKTAFAHFLIEQKLNVEDLYYFYCLEPGFKTYRVVNYWNFCSRAYRNGGYPVTLEMFLEPEDALEPETLKQLAIDELNRLGLMPKGSNILFCQVEVSDQGFPLPTMNNMSITTQRRERIKALNLENLTLIGILSEPDLFFQLAIVVDVYQKVMQKLPPPEYLMETI